MQNQVSSFVLFLISLIFISPSAHLFAGIECDAQSSRIEVAPPAELNIGPNGQTITGTLVHHNGATITGTPLVLSNGILERNGTTANVTGVYNGESTPTIILDGNKTLHADESFTIEALQVSGANNTLKGFALLTNELILPTGIGLDLGLVGPLNKSVELSGGSLTLSRDLRCMSNVEIKGEGTIVTNAYNVHLGTHYSNTLTSSLTWENTQSLVLHSRLTLDGEWTFNNVCIVEGNKQSVELGDDGKITIPAGQTLELRNLTLSGIANDKIVFGDKDSKLILDGCRLGVAEEMFTTAGQVEIIGDTTFVLQEFDWHFTDDGVLTIDGCTLFLSNISNTPLTNLGTIKAPLPVYEDHQKKPINITDNIATGNIATPNSGVITELNEKPVEDAFGGGGGTLTLTNSILMGPDDVIKINEDTVVNGKGARILFARPGKPQLDIAPGKTLMINNVELHNVTGTSIGMGIGSKLCIGENVIFTLSDDVVWREGVIHICKETVFQIRGSGKQRTLTLISPPRGSDVHKQTFDTHLQLGLGTVSLQNVALNGVRHVDYHTKFVDGKTVTGAIALSGNARLDIDRSFVVMHLIAQAQNNQIKVVRNEVTLGGSITFDEYSMSDLRFSFVFPPTFSGTPRIHFENNYLDVSSEQGQASLVFDTSDVRIRNKGPASTLFGNNSVLRGNRVQVESYPAVQSSSRFTIYPGTQLTSALETGALVFETQLQNAMRGPLVSSLTNAWHIKRYMEWAQWLGEDEVRRGISLPDERIKTVLKYASSFAMPPLCGNIYLRDEFGGSYSNMRILETETLNLTLEQGVSVLQAHAPATLKTSDVVNVIGGTMQKPNRLSLTSDTRIEGKVLWDDNAVLIFDFDAATTPPTVTISKDATLDLGNNGTLLVAGRGTLVFEDGATVNFGEGNGRISLENEAQMLLSAGQAVVFRGSGMLECAHAARLIVENGSSLVCGLTADDHITLRISTNASARVGQDLGAIGSDARSYLSFPGSSGTLDCSHVGSVVISRNGMLEFNALRGAVHRGRMREIDIGMGGTLYIAEGGQMSFAENIGGVSGITWNMLGGSLGGDGTVSLHGSQLVGKVQERIFAETNASSQLLVARLLQTVPALSASSVFFDEAGVRKLYTREGVVVALGEDEVITSESSNGTVFGTDSVTGENFLYTAEGNRL